MAVSELHRELQEQFALFLKWHCGCWRVCIEARGKSRTWDVVGINTRTETVHCGEIKISLKDARAGAARGQFDLKKDTGTFHYVVTKDRAMASAMADIIPERIGILYRKQKQHYGCVLHESCATKRSCQYPYTRLFKFFRPATETNGTSRVKQVYKWLEAISQTLSTRQLSDVEMKHFGKTKMARIYKRAVRRVVKRKKRRRS